MRPRHLSLLLMLPAAAACSAPKLGAHTGFVTERSDLQPTAKSATRIEPRYAIPNAGKRIVVIYNHGTSRPQVRENCTAYFNRVPDTLLALRKDSILIFRLCSAATEPRARSGVGTYIYGRMAEVEATIRQLRRAGVKSRHIFVAGHSAGGWTALMLKAKKPALFNAAIAFAPAFAGPRSEEAKYPWWRREARPKQIAEMTRSKAMRALVFAYEDDPFNRPSDLAFLTAAYPKSVTLVPYGCAARRKHLIHHYDCRATDTTKRLLTYIRARVAAAR